MKKKKVLVLCTGNSCRSQMAEAYLRHYGGERIEVYSAGVETHGVNQRAVAVLAEDGLDITHHTSNHIDEYREIDFDYVITVCDNALERCPYFPTDAQKFHHSFPDPAKAEGNDDEIMKQFRTVRDTIKEYCNEWISNNIKV